MDENMQQMDYNALLMNHLNRISFVTTSNFIEAINEATINKYIDPPKIGETALAWGIEYLYCMIPDEMVDNEYKQERKDWYKENKDNMADASFDFARLKALTNLLHRKGLLLSKQTYARQTK